MVRERAPGGHPLTPGTTETRSKDSKNMENNTPETVKTKTAFDTMTLLEQTIEKIPEGAIVLLARVSGKRVVLLSGSKQPELATTVIEKVCKYAVRQVEKMQAGK